MHGEIPLTKIGNTFLWYYYDKSGKELDAIYKNDKGYSCIEIKYQGNVDERDIKKVRPCKDYFILCKENVVYKENLVIVPNEVFLALLPTSERNI